MGDYGAADQNNAPLGYRDHLLVLSSTPSSTLYFRLQIKVSFNRRDSMSFLNIMHSFQPLTIVRNSLS